MPITTTESSRTIARERGERKAKREQLSILVELLKTDENELLTLWLADQVTAVVADEKDLSNKVLSIAKQNIKNQ